MISALPGASLTRSPLRQTSTSCTPAPRANLACSARCKASPWAGMRIRGCTQPIMSRSSSRRGWPETWTRWVRSVMTSMPCVTRPLMTRATAFSLPGMVREEKMTRSPRVSVTSGCSSSAMRDKRSARLALTAGAQRQHLVGRQIAIAFAPRGNPARRRDSRSRARPAPRAPWRGRPARLRARRRARRPPRRGCGRHGRQT